jgi:magnesium transporter
MAVVPFTGLPIGLLTGLRTVFGGGILPVKPCHGPSGLMTVMAAFLYAHGKRVRSITIDEDIAFAPDRSEFVWIGLVDPTMAELQILADRYRLHPLAIEDAAKAHQLPKIDIFDHELFVVARTAHLAKGEIAYGETAIFIGANHIITVRHGSARAHTALRTHIEASPEMLAHGPDYVLHAILDFVVDGYLPIVETIEEEILAMEQATLDMFLGRDQLLRLFTLRRSLMRFQRILGPMGELVAKLVRLDLPCIDSATRPYFSDVHDHVRRVQSNVDALRDTLTQVFEVSSLFEQQRQGIITRQLAAGAAILAVPTAIAGIYGMNFKNMPELDTRYGYFIVVGVMLAICGALFVRFRRAGWL